jgi:hypothetical protein
MGQVMAWDLTTTRFAQAATLFHAWCLPVPGWCCCRVFPPPPSPKTSGRPGSCLTTRRECFAQSAVACSCVHWQYLLLWALDLAHQLCSTPSRPHPAAAAMAEPAEAALEEGEAQELLAQVRADEAPSGEPPPAPPAPGPMWTGPGSENISDKVLRLRQEATALKDKRVRISKDLKNAKRQKTRLTKKASMLSATDLANLWEMKAKQGKLPALPMLAAPAAAPGPASSSASAPGGLWCSRLAWSSVAPLRGTTDASLAPAGPPPG